MRFTALSYKGPSSELERLREDRFQSFATAGYEPRIADIRVNWPRTRAAIVELLTLHPQPWTAEFLKYQCEQGDCLYIEADGGFVIAKVTTDEHSKDRSLFIWIAYAHDRGNRFVEEHDAYFVALAKCLECRYIETRTPINGVYSYLLANGWDLKTHVLTKDLHEQPRQK